MKPREPGDDHLPEFREPVDDFDAYPSEEDLATLDDDGDAGDGRAKEAKPATDAKALPIIRMGLDLDRVVSETLQCLPNVANLYRRNGGLVRVAPREVDPRQALLERARATNPDAPRPRGYIERAPGSPTIRPHTDATIDRALSLVARFERARKNRDGETEWVPCAPSARVLSNLLADGTWPGVDPLVGVAGSPLLRVDGSVAQVSGYDRGTGHVLTIPPDMPTIKAHATHSDAVRAVAHLRDLVSDFPWTSETDFAAWLALPLTLVCRNAIMGPTPFFGVSANSKGSGKSRLVDIASIIVNGSGAPRGSQPKDDAETAKLLTSIALEGDSLLLVDNCDRPIGGGAFDRWATGDVWKDRLLGLNATLTAPITAVLAFTSNNPIYLGDTVDRVLPIRLESPLEDPRSRTGFKIPNILAHVRRNRCALLGDLLTLAAAWFAEGQHRTPVTWGSFEAWTDVVPQILIWAGLESPMATRANIADSDPANAALRTLVDGWTPIEATAATVGVSARELVDCVFDKEWNPRAPFVDLAAALEQLAPGRGRERCDARRLGYVLRHNAGRVIGGKRLRRAGDTGGFVRWTVR